MTRYNPGIYAIRNTLGYDVTLNIDNVPLTSLRDTLLTVNVKDNMYVNVPGNDFFIVKVGMSYDSVIGNVADGN